MKKVKMTLVGVDGNAFAIMAAFTRNARRQGWCAAEINEVLKQAKSGDYDNLICVILDNIDDSEDDEFEFE